MLKHPNIIFFLFLNLFVQILFAQEKCLVIDENQQEIYAGNAYKKHLDSLTSIGYFTLKIDSIQQRNCIIYVHKGKQFQKIWVEGHPKIINEKLLFDKHQDAYYTQDLDGYVQLIKDSLERNGQPFAKIYLQPKGFVGNNAMVQLSVSSEKERKINDIQFVGYEKFPPAVKQDLLKMDLTYNEQNVAAISERLNQQNFVISYDSPKVSFTQDSTTLYMYVKKMRQNVFDGLVGFGTDENNTFNVQGNVQIRLQNAFNRLEKLQFHWQSAENKSQQIDINTAFPSVFRTKFGVQSGLNLQKQDSTYVRLEWRNGISYHFSPLHYISGNFNIASSNYIEEENAVNQDFRKSGFGVGYYFQDANLTTLKGNKTLLDVTSGIWNRKQDNQENEEQTEILYQIIRQQKIYKNHYVMGSVFGENLIQEGKVLVNDNYLVGGFNSIRGFNQNSISTKSMNALTLAYRFIPNNNILFEIFNDTALIDSKDGEDNNTFISFGIGTQFNTRFGFFQLNYAVGKTHDTSFDFSNGKIHIGIKNYF